MTSQGRTGGTKRSEHSVGPWRYRRVPAGELPRLGATEQPAGHPFWRSLGWWKFIQDDPAEEAHVLVVEHQSDGPALLALTFVIWPGSSIQLYDPLSIAGDLAALGGKALDPAAAQRVETAVQRLRAHAPEAYPVVTVAALGSASGLRPVRDEVDRDAYRRALQQAPAVVDAFASEIGAKTRAFLYLDDAELQALHGGAARLGYSPIFLGADSFLEVPPSGFDGYLARFTSHRRRRIRHEAEAFAKVGARVAVEEGPAALRDDYARLRAALRSRYGQRGDVEWARAETARLRDTVRDRVVVASARRDGKLLGFVTAFRDGRDLRTRSAGFDYALLRDEYCYFNVVYYEPIRWAAQRGLERIWYGLGSYEAKALRGCRFQTRHGLVASTSPIARYLLEALAVQGDSERRAIEELAARS